jgi:phosphate/sulfate permease
MADSASNPPSPEQKPVRRKLPFWLVASLVGVGMTIVLPLLLVTGVLAIQYSRGQIATVIGKEHICVIYYRYGKDDILLEKPIDCDQIESEKNKISGRYIGFDYAYRLNINYEINGKISETKVNIKNDEYQTMSNTNYIRIAKMDSPLQKITVMGNWTYIFSPVTSSFNFLKNNTGLWIGPIAYVIIIALINGLKIMYRHVRRRWA